MRLGAKFGLVNRPSVDAALIGYADLPVGSSSVSSGYADPLARFAWASRSPIALDRRGPPIWEPHVKRWPCPAEAGSKRFTGNDHRGNLNGFVGIVAESPPVGSKPDVWSFEAGFMLPLGVRNQIDVWVTRRLAGGPTLVRRRRLYPSSSLAGQRYQARHCVQLPNCTGEPRHRVARDGHREARLAERLADDPIRVEVDLPVVLVAAVRPDAQQWSGRRELEDLNVRGGSGEHVRNPGRPFFQQADGDAVIHGVVDRRREIDAAIRICREVLDGSEKTLLFPTMVSTYRRVDGRAKQSDGFNGAGDTSRADEVADLERSQEDEECAGREICQQPAPGDTDGHTARRQKRGERGRFHAEETKDCNDQGRVQEDRQARCMYRLSVASTR